MKKVLFVATVVKKHINAFHIPYLKMFKNCGWETSVCARNDYEETEKCIIPYCDKYYDIPFERSPLKRQNFKAYKKMKELIDKEKYDIIHCHTPVGGVIARLGAKKARKKYGTKVFYTAHGFHFYKGAPIINWLVYYPVEWLCSFVTDVLITINTEDYERASRVMHAKRTEYVPGVGIDTKKFFELKVNKKDKFLEFGIKNEMVFLSVGELNKNKNQEVIIKALSKIDIPFKYILCGKGDRMEYLAQLAYEDGIEDKVIFAGYRNDINELLKCADVFCFPSLREGLSVALMEAMAVGLPCVVSKIRGNIDLIKDGINGFLCKPESVSEFETALEKIAKNRDLQARMKEANYRIITDFDKDKVMDKMKELYSL